MICRFPYIAEKTSYETEKQWKTASPSTNYQQLNKISFFGTYSVNESWGHFHVNYSLFLLHKYKLRNEEVTETHSSILAWRT